MASESRSSLRPGATLGGQYQILKPLGAGGVGQVFLAQDISLTRQVAIKVLRSRHLGREDIDARFRREARLLSRFSHPNIIAIYAFGTTEEGDHYIVMELARGVPLDAYLARNDRVPPALLITILEQVASAMDEAHRHGMVHRDLKPGNIMFFEAEQRVQVVDFGLAKLFVAKTPTELHEDGVVTVDHTKVMGSPAYMAPEQARGQQVDGRADIYALGVTACRLLTGRLPITADSTMGFLFAQIKEAPRLPSLLRPEMGFAFDDPVDQVFARVLEKDPEARYANATDFVRALEQALRGVLPGAFSEAARTDDVGGVAPRLPAIIEALSGQSPRLDAHVEPISAWRALTVLHLKLRTRFEPLQAAEADDELRESLALLRARITQATRLYLGVPLGAMSDRLVLLYGLEPEDGRARELALDAALNLRSTLTALRHDPALPPSFSFDFGIGLDTGRALILRDEAGGLTVHGACLSGARRMAEHGPVDTIVITGMLYRRVRELYQCPGLATSIEALAGARSVLAKRHLALSAQHAIHGVEIDLRGRQREVNRLRHLFKESMLREAPITVAVTGPYGIGKSRIVGELVRQILDLPDFYRVYFGRASATRSDVPYAPFIEAIRNHARLDHADKPEVVRLKLEQFFRQKVATDPTELSGEEHGLYRFLAEQLGIDVEREAAQTLTLGPDDDRGRMLSLMTKLMQRLSRSYPMLLIVEDMQWSTQATRLLLRSLHRSEAERGLLMVLVWRVGLGESVELDFLEDTERATTLPIGPLHDVDMKELVRHMLRRVEGLPSHLVERIASLTEGSPLIAEETVRELIDSGLLRAEEHSAWRLEATPRELLESPRTARQLFAARVHRLEPETREVLEAASAAGEIFWPDLLEMLSAGAGEALPQLLERGFFHERRDVVVDGEHGLSFARETIREVLYQALSPDRQRVLHLRVVAWLESCAESLPGLERMLSEHCERAGLPDEALEHRVAAARQAARHLLTEEAIHHYEACVRLAETHHPPPHAREQHLELRQAIHSELLQQLLRAGEPERAIASAQRVLEWARQGRVGAELLCRVAILQGDAFEMLDREEQALSVFHNAARYAQSLSGESALALLAELRAARIQTRRGRASEAASAIARLLEEHGKKSRKGPAWMRAIATAHIALGDALRELREVNGAESAYKRGYRLAMGTGEPGLLVDALMGRGLLHLSRERLNKAEAAWDRALELASDHQLLQRQARLHLALGELELKRSSVPDAREHFERSRELYHLVGARAGLSRALERLAYCALRSSTITEAWRLAEEALTAGLESASPGAIEASLDTLLAAQRALDALPMWPDAVSREAVLATLEDSVTELERLELKRLVARVRDALLDVREDTAIMERPVFK